MKIAVASGKGGTGKTLVAAHLARAASRTGRSVGYLDCDVESPNGHIFLKPQFVESTPVGVLVPRVDERTCTHCGDCGEICRYGAIVPLPQTTLVFPELCHGCGGCALTCPARAITEVRHATGRVEVGRAGPIAFVQGTLEAGQPLSPPVIRAVGAAAPASDLLVVDAPPGTGCPAIESVRDADYVVLVAEPTPFGLHDLQLALAMVRALDLRFGVVLNRANVGDGATVAYCRARGIPILAELPEDRRVAEASSRGELLESLAPNDGALLAAVLAGAAGGVN